MSPSVNPDLEVPEETISSLDSRMAKMLLDYHAGGEPCVLNARAVEFIAKPGRVDHLRNCIRQEVADLLQQQIGFVALLVLTSHKEPRLIQVLSFWDTAGQSTENHWEELPAIRRILSPLIDVRGKVHSYEAALPESPDSILPSGRVRAC
ncbi:MAG: hypothetical protein WCA15_18455 [Candidatus Acidiferrales bacterium]